MGFTAKIIAALMMLALTGYPLVADTTMVVRVSYPLTGTQTLQTFQIQKDRVRLNLSNQNYDTSYIYRRDLNLLWIVDERNKNYFEFSASDMEALKEKIDSKILMLESQEALPYVQKSRLQKLKQLQVTLRNPVFATEVEYKLVDLKKPLGSWECLLYEGWLNQKKSSQVWTLHSEKLGMSPEEIETFVNLKQFTFHLAGQISGLGNLLYSSDRFKGVVVRSEDFGKTNVVRRSEIVSLKPDQFDGALFDLPAELIKKEWQLE